MTITHNAVHTIACNACPATRTYDDTPPPDWTAVLVMSREMHFCPYCAKTEADACTLAAKYLRRR